MSRGVGHRRSSNLALLWLWHWLAGAAPIRPLAWEPPYAIGAVLKSKKNKKQKTKQTNKQTNKKQNLKNNKKQNKTKKPYMNMQRNSWLAEVMKLMTQPAEKPGSDG